MSTLLIDLEGKELEQEEVELLSHPLVAGLILFTRNFEDREQIQELIRSVRLRVKKPLLITVVSVMDSQCYLQCRLFKKHCQQLNK